MRRFAGVLVLVMLVGSLAWGQAAPDPAKGGESEIYVHQEGRVAIPDDGYDGTLGSMVCLDVPGQAGTINDINVQVAITHTWVGDLVIKLVSPSSEVLTLLSRPGYGESADDGTGCCGDSSNLDLNFPITFDDSAATSAEDMGSTLSGGVICQDDGICTFAPAPGAGPGTNLAQFIGQDGAGTWQVCVGDSAGGDTGDFDSAQIIFDVTAPPTPTPQAVPGVPAMTPWGLAALLLTMAGVAVLLLRRRG